MPGDLPHAVLFACTQNVIRSPMAAAIMKHFYGHKVYVASAGVKPGDPDPFIAAVLDEIGIDLGKHRPHNFSDLEDASFDLAIRFRRRRITGLWNLPAPWLSKPSTGRPWILPPRPAAANKFSTVTARCATDWKKDQGKVRGAGGAGRIK